MPLYKVSGLFGDKPQGELWKSFSLNAHTHRVKDQPLIVQAHVTRFNAHLYEAYRFTQRWSENMATLITTVHLSKIVSRKLWFTFVDESDNSGLKW